MAKDVRRGRDSHGYEKLQQLIKDILRFAPEPIHTRLSDSADTFYGSKFRVYYCVVHH